MLDNMYIYLIVFIILLFSSLIEYFHKSTPKILFKVLFLLLTLMLVFRFGQGTDYTNYYDIYNGIPASLNPVTLLRSDIHGELGWLELNALFKLLHISYEIMIVIISLIESYFLLRFYNRFCKYKILALTLSYPTLYLTYMYNTIRQGFVICVFLGLLLELYLNHKYVKYFIGCILLALIHSSALMLIIILVVKNRQIMNFKFTVIIILSWLFGFFVYFAGTSFISVLPFIPASVSFYIGSASLSATAIAERIISFLFVLTLMMHKEYVSDDLRKLFNVYSIGFIIYGLALWNPLISSRFCYPFKVLEILLISNMLYYKNAYLLNRFIRFAFIIMLTTVMYFKNIDSYIVQGSYYQSVNVLKYPYISLFNKKSITKYRSYPYEIK